MERKTHQAELDLCVLDARSGSRQAFERLFGYFNPIALRFAYRICGNAELARDATQEAWLEVANSIRRLTDPRAFRAWLLKLVRWRVLDQLRREQRHVHARSELDADELPNVDEVPDDASQSQFLAQCIEKLSATERQLIHLYYLEQFSVVEIAAIVDVPTGTVKSRLHRVRNRLKSLLTADSNTAALTLDSKENSK